jgi:hypothetical protein
MRLTDSDGSCLPLHLILESGRTAMSGKDKHSHRALRAKKPRKPASLEVDSVSLTNVFHYAVSALRNRLPLLALMFTAFVVGCLATLSSFRAVSKALPFSPVFSAPIHDTIMIRQPNDSPHRIPRIIHQTARTFDGLEERVVNLRESWSRFNPDWELQEWDDARCREFVKKEFPEYFVAYTGLPKSVERADFFRYLVVLRYGGVYADIDTECKQPLSQAIRPTDTLLVGWEGEVPDHDTLVHRHFARYRQVRSTASARSLGAHFVREGACCICSLADHIVASAGAAVVLCGSSRTSRPAKSLRPHRCIISEALQ